MCILGGPQWQAALCTPLAHCDPCAQSRSRSQSQSQSQRVTAETRTGWKQRSIELGASILLAGTGCVSGMGKYPTSTCHSLHNKYLLFSLDYSTGDWRGRQSHMAHSLVGIYRVGFEPAPSSKWLNNASCCVYLWASSTGMFTVINIYEIKLSTIDKHSTIR